MELNHSFRSVVEKDISWREVVSRYHNPEVSRSLWQLANSVLPFLLMWYLMVRSLGVAYWLTLLLAFPTAGFMVRTFIIFHDCGHGSFFRSKRANTFFGYLTGILTLTPYDKWKHDHAIHHATAGDLDRRGVGDVKVLTVDEYLALPPLKRLGYRIMRNPLIMFSVGAVLVFAVGHRFYTRNSGRRERQSVWITNLALVGIIALLCYGIGVKAFLLVELPVLLIATSAGVWLFYVQHQFEDVYWERHDRWEFVKAGLDGSSFYKLPKVLQWFSGNIGYHHIHHLSPRIPNYLLEKCHRENPLFHIQPLTPLRSLKLLSMRLYDEKNKRMVGYRFLKIYRQQIELG